MNDETQNLIICIFGIDSIIGLIGLLLIVGFANCDLNVILALMTVVSAPINLMGGFITGKTMNDIQSETIREHIIDEYFENKEMIDNDFDGEQV